MKGIKVGTLHRYEMFIFGIISIITFINEVKIFITMLYADYNWFVYIDEDTIPFIMISSLLASAVTLIMSVYYIFQAILVKRTTVCIELNGLTIHFLVCELGKQEIKDFYREVSKMQNERISEVQNDAIQKQMPDQPDKVKKLMNLSHLYEQGLLQREEFEKLKNEIINEP